MPFAVNRNGFAASFPNKFGQKYATTQVAINQRSRYFDKRRLTRFIAALDSFENFAAERSDSRFATRNADAKKKLDGAATKKRFSVQKRTDFLSSPRRLPFEKRR
jgi:hypothetical protein